MPATSDNRLRSLIAIFIVIMLAGCSGSSRTGESKPVNIAPRVASEAYSRTVAAPRAEADAFLKALVRGDFETASAKVAVSFKKQLTKPVYEDEQKVGYSEDDMQKQLKAWWAEHPPFEVETEFLAPSNAEMSFHGSLKGGADKAAFALRLTKSEAGWQVTRFAVTRPIAHALADTNSAELAWQRQTALDFLDSFLGGPEDQELTMLTMTTEFKQRLPSPSIADTALGYAKKDVRKWLNDHRGSFSGLSVSEQKQTPRGLELAGVLMGSGESRKYSLVMINRDGVALVDHLAFE